MDIAMMAMLQSQPLTQTQVSTAVLDMNLDSIEQIGDSFIKMMEQSITPNLGQNIDIKL